MRLRVKTIPFFMTPKEEDFRKHCWKGESVNSVFSSHTVFYQIKDRNNPLSYLYFYAPISKDRGHIVLLLSVCLSAQTLHENLTFSHYS